MSFPDEHSPILLTIDAIYELVEGLNIPTNITIWNSARPVFPETVSVLCVLKDLCPDVPQNSFWGGTCPRVSRS